MTGYYTNSAAANATATASKSSPVLGILGIILVVLKLNPGDYLSSPVENWSWWWVTAPFWGPFALFLILVALVGLGILGYAVIGTLVDGVGNRRKRKRQAANRQRKGILQPTRKRRTTRYARGPRL